MKVYLVVEEQDYEYEHVIGVYTQKDQAEKIADAFEATETERRRVIDRELDAAPINPFQIDNWGNV